jgi:hypothetical protein
MWLRVFEHVQTHGHQATALGCVAVLFRACASTQASSYLLLWREFTFFPALHKHTGIKLLTALGFFQHAQAHGHQATALA